MLDKTNSIYTIILGGLVENTCGPKHHVKIPSAVWTARAGPLDVTLIAIYSIWATELALSFMRVESSWYEQYVHLCASGDRCIVAVMRERRDRRETGRLMHTVSKAWKAQVVIVMTAGRGNQDYGTTGGRWWSVLTSNPGGRWRSVFGGHGQSSSGRQGHWPLVFT